MSIEAMKQAREVIELGDDASLAQRYAVLTNIDQAIAEAEKQEPVAWMYDFLNTDNRDEVIRNWTTQDYADIERENGFNVRPLYTHPPKREPLTDEQMLELLVGIDSGTKRLPPGFQEFARAIEAAHGIKVDA